MNAVLSDKLVNEHEAASILGVAVQTLRVWRCNGRYALPYKKLGRAVRYSTADLREFIEARSVTSTTQAERL
jgi:hypothetical protein